ncbi:MAG: hypothetical protein PWR28_236 [Synergistaceae bacterium]|jgi:hypothetical protein|nr:hypothetical protein [Synergistaceae bacterium]
MSTPIADSGGATLTVEKRSVRIKLGKRSYNVRTALEPEQLDRIVALLHRVVEESGNNRDQEELLVLTSLRLAFFLDDIASKLESLIGEGRNRV